MAGIEPQSSTTLDPPVALVIRRVQGYSVVRAISSSLRGSTGPSLLFAVVYPVGFIGIAALLALTTGLGTYQAGPENIIVLALRQGGVVLLALFLLMSLIRMYGEEFGWRGYLLPELTARWGRARATAAVGVVWALFHSAFLRRETRRHPVDPIHSKSTCLPCVNQPLDRFVE
jgi:membrane protease YdiL (CAAX protease family)